MLVLRFAALGDVATMSSVLMRRAEMAPDCQFTILTHPMLLPLFKGAANVRAIPIDKTLGIWRIFRDLRRLRPTHVIDGHNNLRTICIRILFFLTGTRVVYLHKYRRTRCRLTRQKHKVLRQMTPWWKVYDRMFAKCGLPGEVVETPLLQPSRDSKPIYNIGVALSQNTRERYGLWTGWRRQSVIWPLEDIAVYGFSEGQCIRRLWMDGLMEILLW